MPKTVIAALPAALLAALASLGLDAEGCRARAGIELDALADPDGRIALETHTRLWREIAALGGDVGIALGRVLALRGLGVVGHAMAHAETVGDAIACVGRFRRLVLDDALPTLEVDGDEARFTQVLPPAFAALRHPGECQVTATLTTLRLLGGRPELAARRVGLVHPAPPSLDAHHAALGTRRIEFGAKTTVLVVEASILARPIARADPALRDYLVARAEALGRALPPDEAVAPVIRAALARALPAEVPIERLARGVGMSTRTLQRRLRGEGTSVPMLLDEIRRAQALLLLAEPRRRVGEVAYALGYRDQTTFARAFRRWTGEAPEAFRQRGSTR